MTDKLKDWSTVPASNNLAGNEGWPELMPPSNVNNTGRANMGRLRELYEEMDWQNLKPTITAASSGSVTLTGDLTAFYVPRRMVRISDGVTPQIGFINTSVFGGVSTVVTIVGTPTTAVTPTSIEVGVRRTPAMGLQSTKDTARRIGFHDTTNPDHITVTGAPVNMALAASIASAGTTSIGAATGNYVHITGTTTITSFGTAPQAGTTRWITFDGALTLTHNATSLIIPGGANIATTAGATAIVVAETTSNWRVLAYQGASFSSLVLLATVSPNNSAGETFTLSNYVTCSTYELEFLGVKGTSNNTRINLTLNGAVSNFTYGATGLTSAGVAIAFSANTTTSIAICDPARGIATAGGGVNGRVEVQRGGMPSVHWKIYVEETTGGSTSYFVTGGGARIGVTTLTSITVIPTVAGNLDGGSIRLYGRI